MSRRFYAPAASWTGQRVRLSESEASHLTRVLRLKAGSRVRVFDGQGHEFSARVATVDSKGVVVETLEPVDSARESRVAVTLAQAVIKGRKFDKIVRDATMLGVTTIQPLITAHTDVSSASVYGSSPRARWQRIALASAKQSGRAVVPSVELPIPLAKHLSDANDGLHIVLVEPGATPANSGLETLANWKRPEHAIVTIGPEGGWAEAEIDSALRAGCKFLTLGSRTLRSDATPVAAISILLFLWEEL